MSSFSWLVFSRSWKLFLLAALGGGILATLFSFVSPLRYGSSVRLLVTQTNAIGLDPYTAVKSTERIAANLSEIVHTSTFAGNVIMRAQGFDAAYFPLDEYAKRRAWSKALSTSVVAGTGIMELTAYHPLREQARLLADAASQELAVQAPNYFGYNVRVQVIDPPLDSRWFAQPSFVRNGVFGFIFGLLLGMIWRFARLSASGRSS